MPALDMSDETTKFVAPTTEKLPEDQQGWVEMTTHPLCAEDYLGVQGKVLAEVDVDGIVLATRIKRWNYTDTAGSPLEITAAACSRLPFVDQRFFMNQIKNEALPTEVGSEVEKDDSSLTLSPNETASK